MAKLYFDYPAMNACTVKSREWKVRSFSPDSRLLILILILIS
jgi:hypothetical protein